jgi:hypothetical protein
MLVVERHDGGVQENALLESRIYPRANGFTGFATD